MAVYKKTYRRYEGALTPAWSRFLILPRYSFAEMRESRFYTTFFLGTMLPPLAFALIIYLRHNATALDSFGLDPSRILNIDADFFLNFLGLQAMLAFFVAVFRGPGLVSPEARRRFGDLMVISRGRHVIEYRPPGNNGRIMEEASQHSGLTPEEMRVPLVLA